MTIRSRRRNAWSGANRTIARYYRSARTEHLVRLKEFVPGVFIYSKKSYDFDASMVPSDQLVMRRSSLWVALRYLRGDFCKLELTEPMAASCLPGNMLICFAARLRAVLRPSDPGALVTYSIENAPVPKLISRWLLKRIPRSAWLERALSQTIAKAMLFCANSFSRICFGTQAALSNYQESLGLPVGNWMRSGRASLIWGLAKPRNGVSTKNPRSPRACFLGAFDERKGVLALLGAWRQVQERVPNADLYIMGKGELTEVVRDRVSGLPDAQLSVSPSRREIFQSLASAKCLVLPSRPWRWWREQIGLPILEALSCGCEIVTSADTGIADWLRTRGHHVLQSGFSDKELGEAVAEALLGRDRQEQIIESLPSIDGRKAADTWLFQED